MRNFLMLLTITGLWAAGAMASPSKHTETALLKRAQKQEIKRFKLKEKYEKQMLKNQQLPKAVRIQMKHRLQREDRRLKNRQKDERQKLKDQQRILREGYKQLGSD